jgi:hypothetical protein
MRRAMELLARIEKQELDRGRLALQAIEAEMEARRGELATLRQRLATEHEAAWALPGGPGRLAAYFRSGVERQQRLGALGRELEHAQGLARQALAERLKSYKSLDLAARRLQEEATRQAAHAARREVEEASQLKAASAPARQAVRPG